MTDLLGYRGKRVAIAGCFSGMGEACARLLVEAGAEVHGVDIKPSPVSMASFTELDLKDPAAIEAAIAAIGGEIDGLALLVEMDFQSASGGAESTHRLGDACRLHTGRNFTEAEFARFKNQFRSKRSVPFSKGQCREAGSHRLGVPFAEQRRCQGAISDHVSG